jgi:hypothetical protein
MPSDLKFETDPNFDPDTVTARKRKGVDVLGEMQSPGIPPSGESGTNDHTRSSAATTESMPGPGSAGTESARSPVVTVTAQKKSGRELAKEYNDSSRQKISADFINLDAETLARDAVQTLSSIPSSERTAEDEKNLINYLVDYQAVLSMRAERFLVKGDTAGALAKQEMAHAQLDESVLLADEIGDSRAEELRSRRELSEAVIDQLSPPISTPYHAYQSCLQDAAEFEQKKDLAGALQAYQNARTSMEKCIAAMREKASQLDKGSSRADHLSKKVDECEMDLHKLDAKMHELHSAPVASVAPAVPVDPPATRARSDAVSGSSPTIKTTQVALAPVTLAISIKKFMKNLTTATEAVTDAKHSDDYHQARAHKEQTSASPTPAANDAPAATDSKTATPHVSFGHAK